VRDIGATEVTGLEGTAFCDCLCGSEPVGGEPHPVRFSAEIDRVYLGTGATTTVHDFAAGRSLLIGKGGSETTVVWNPWIDKSADLPDFGDDEWKHMVCVETGNLRDAAVRLAPGGSHTMAAVFELLPSTRTSLNRSTTS
jgi:glucose-6-phosphate 1-epimerase